MLSPVLLAAVRDAGERYISLAGGGTLLLLLLLVSADWLAGWDGKEKSKKRKRTYIKRCALSGYLQGEDREWKRRTLIV